MPAESLHSGYGIDTRDFRAFAKALRVASPEIAKELRVRLRGVGEIVAEEARTRASEHSTTIAATISVRTAGATVSVIAGGPDSLIAALFELGNKGSRSTDVFRHPVFGHGAWVSQAMHPYLQPALASKFNEVEIAAVEALDKAIEMVMAL